MKPEPGEGKAHEMKESPEEEVREGSESEEGHYGKTSRKRSAQGAKKTKAPMDAEGCGCGGKKGATCDGNCGSSMKKRSDALTPQEYLAACDLGIQGRGRSYIRARLDSQKRLDLKCGNGAISQGEKCHKGTASNTQGISRKTLTGRETGILSRERIKREGWYGSQLGGDPFNRKVQAQRVGAFNAAAGAALGGAMGYAIGGGAKGALIGAGISGAVTGTVGTAVGALTAQINRGTSRAANRSLQREKFEKPIAAAYSAKRARMSARGVDRKKIREYDMKTAMRLAKGYDRIMERTRGRYGADSIWAEGF